jgi:hypothetical protein
MALSHQTGKVHERRTERHGRRPMPRIKITYTYEYDVTPGEGGYEGCDTVENCLDFDLLMTRRDIKGNFNAMIDVVGFYPTIDGKILEF